MLKTAGVSIELINQTTLPLKTPVIIISNHQSHFDIPALFSVLPIKISILTKMELFKIPIFGWLMKKAGHISVDRFNSQKSKEALLKAENMLNDVEGILIFAEGTRSSDGNIQKFKKGGFFLAANTCAPILPVVIKGSIDIHKKGGKKLHSGKIKITFLDCFHVEFRDPDKIRFLCHELHDKMTEIYRSL